MSLTECLFSVTDGEKAMIFNMKIYGKALCGETVCALGYFDGVHIGHRKLFETLLSLAEGRQTVALTFDPHPMEFINRELAPKLINTAEQRVRKILSLGVDTVIMAKFDSYIANVPAEDFIKNFIVRTLNAKAVCVGFNFRFGNNRQGDVNLLRELENKYGYRAYIENAVIYKDLPVSSTRIRSILYEGHMTVAKNLLGDYFTLQGTVEKGRQVGRVMGFPTANISIAPNQIMPAWGVYVTYAEIEGKRYFAGCNVGIKPTFGLNYVTCEAHFINKDNSRVFSDLYGKKINLVFVKKIRDEIEFPNTEALIERIKMDMKTVEEYSRTDKSEE